MAGERRHQRRARHPQTTRRREWRQRAATAVASTRSVRLCQRRVAIAREAVELGVGGLQHHEVRQAGHDPRGVGLEDDRGEPHLARRPARTRAAPIGAHATSVTSTRASVIAPPRKCRAEPQRELLRRRRRRTPWRTRRPCSSACRSASTARCRPLGGRPPASPDNATETVRSRTSCDVTVAVDADKVGLRLAVLVGAQADASCGRMMPDGRPSRIMERVFQNAMRG